MSKRQSKNNPPLLTGGYSPQNEKSFSVPFGYNNQIDWLQMTFNWSDNPLALLPDWDGFEWFRELRPMNNYSDCVELVCGAKLCLNPLMKDLGVHFVATGVACRNIRERYGSDNAMLKQFFKVMPRKITRIDVANDVVGFNFVPRLQELSERGLIKTRMRPYAKHQDWSVKDGGQSAYWGSPTSELRVRAYDKAVEQGIVGMQWTRLEWQLRDDVAGRLFVNAANSDNPMRAIKASVKSRFSIEDDWFNELMGGDVMKMEIPNKEPEYEKWLFDTVLSSMLKHYQQGANIEAIDRFQTALQGGLEELRNKK